MRFRLPALLAAALCAAACGPRYARVPVYDRDGLAVALRSEQRDGRGVPRGFAHPATIHSTRVANILARLDVRMGAGDGGERVAAFPTAMLYPIAGEVSRALAQAGPDQEVVVRALRTEKRMGIFHQRFLTSFLASMQGDDLILRFGHVEWAVPKEDEGEEPPEPHRERQVQEFEVLASEGIVPVGRQAVAVDWRSPIFREATHLRVGEGGKLLRRSVLVEAPAEAGGVEEAPAPLPADLPPETLRALADLQERRARGEISETLYHQRRRDLLRAAADAERAR
jgi:hypothetical protein